MSDRGDAGQELQTVDCSFPDLDRLCRAAGIDPAGIGENEELEAVLAALEAEITARERRDIERMQEMMQKLGMLSHKINNPLTSLLGRAQLLRVSKDTDPKVGKAAEVIEESARRIADHIRELANLVSEGRELAANKLRTMEGRQGEE
jgi:signal transduction histidine kinase